MNIKTVLRALVTGSLLCVLASAANAKVTLTYSVFFPPTHPHAVASVAMAEEIEKRTNGEVKITVFPGGTLTKPQTCYDGVVKGISDLCLSAFAYTRGRFPVMEAVDLPLGYPNGLAASKVAWEFFQQLNPDELKDVKVLAIHAHGPGVLAAKKDVNSFADIAGMKIRCTGLSAKIAENLGAAPVAMAQNEAYEALQKGVVEGTLVPIETLKGWKQGEVIDYVIESKALSYTTTMFVVMNKKKYDALSPEIKKVFDEVGAEWVNVHGKVWDDADRDGRQFVTDLGKKIHALTADEEAAWVKAVAPIMADYIAAMEGKKLPGQDAVTLLQELIRKYSQP